MGKEIKIQFSEAERALTNLKTKTDALNNSIPVDNGHGNQLEVMDRLNELNASLQELLFNYQSFLTKNESTAQEVLKDMKEFEKMISKQFEMK